jgi:Gpi18-like mannosyltransferase
MNITSTKALYIEKFKTIKYVLTFFFLNKLLILFVGLSALNNVNTSKGSDILQKLKFLFELNYSRWDSGWYEKIAAFGYITPKSAAFFPLYPMLMKMLSIFTGISLISAGLIISNISFLMVIYFARKLFLIDYSEKETNMIILLLIFFPTSYYFSAVYTEALFMLLVLLTIYNIRKRNWMLAGIAGFFATLTRNTGVFLVLPFLIEYLITVVGCEKLKNREIGFKDVKKYKTALWEALIPLSLIIYMFYQWIHFGNCLAFVKAEGQFGRHNIDPFKALWMGISTTISNHMMRFKPDWIHLYYAIELFVIILIICVLIFCFRKLRLSYLIIILYSFLIPMSDPVLGHSKDYFVSMSRYALVIFPLYPGIFELFRKHRVLYWMVQGVFICFLAILVYGWTKGKWVA